MPALPTARRRAAFVMHRFEHRAVIGFHERSGTRIVDIEDCPVLDHALLRLAGVIRAAVPKLIAIGETARATVNLLDTGADLLITLPGEPDRVILKTLSALAVEADLCRVSTVRDGVGRGPAASVVERRKPRIDFAGVGVSPPPGVFFQATAGGAAAIVDAVLAGVGSSRRILDLFGGCGALTFPLAQRGRVHAVDGDPLAVAALRDAAGRAGLSGRISAEHRDLRNRPLIRDDLAGYDAAVFDPPRIGAQTQARELAVAGPERVVAVSCNPDTFARDVRILANGGYRLDCVILVDQFLWLPHVELIAHFSRETAGG